MEVDGVREAERNRLARRADWRFLVPDPSPALSICFAEGQLLEAVRAISGQVVGKDADATETCDLAVAVNPDRDALARAYAALRPGGSLYTEWTVPAVLGPKGVRRRLRAGGFDEVTCYWPWPARSHPQFWLPIEADGPVRYFLASRPSAPTVTRRLALRVRRTLWYLSLRAGFMLPICAVAKKPHVNQ